MRTRTCIDFDWRFAPGDAPAAGAARFDDGAWRELDLPHDWSVESAPNPDNPSGAAGGFYPGGIGWYRRRIEIPADLGDRRVLVEFDGVYMNAEVWCNGRSCGVRPYGYSSFCHDLTPHVTAGEPAVIAVRVDNSRQKNCRWYSGSGIYRHVWLTLAGPVRVDHWGTFVTTPDVSEKRAGVECKVTVVNGSGTDADVEVNVECRKANDGGGGRSADCRAAPHRIQIPNTDHRTLTAFLEIPDPELWSPDAPYLYALRVELKRAGRVVDTCDTRFGIRSIRFDADEGFFLNGRSMKFRGVNEHHDAGCLGAAVPDDVIRRRLRILKAMGCNAIRTAHNPASPAFLDLCDEMGFLVVEDAFDEWKDGKTPHGYGRYWEEWWERDLVDMIRRDRNHPGIVMWSVGNEIREVREGRPEGLPMMKALQAVCHREDPTRPMTCGCCNSRETLAAGYGRWMDVFGYNGGGGGCFDYEKDHAAYPGMPMFATEVPHTLQTRGVYRTRTWYRDLAANKDNIRWLEPSVGKDGPREVSRPAARAEAPSFFAGVKNARPLDLMIVPDLAAEEVFGDFDEHYQSSYDNALVRISSRDSWRRTRALPHVCGEFRWTGFDYLGECYAWPCKSWNFGVIDLGGFPKDTYYFYQSQWTEAPMVHLLPHWTWPGLEGRVIPVIGYTNCDRVELFLDGESLGVRERDDAAMCLRWDVPYRAGTLRAAGYRGQELVAGCVHETAGKPSAIRLDCEEASLRADRAAVAHVAASVVDAKGRFAPRAGPEIVVEVRGPARLIGLENGDPLDTASGKRDRRRAFHGLLLAVVQADGGPGRVTITARAEGLKGAVCEL